MIDHDYCFVVFLWQLSVKGYNDKQHVMLQKLMDKITAFDIDSKRFDILLEKVCISESLELKRTA